MKKIINRTSGTLAMKLDTQAKSNIKKTYNLAAGDPNLPVSRGLQQGLWKATVDGIHQYCGAQGVLELRESLYNDPEKVLITNGSKQAIYLALSCTCEPGDTVMVIGPSWPSYKEMCKVLNLKFVQYTAYANDWWRNDPLEIESLMANSQPDVVIFCNPNNPTGVVEGKYFVEGLVKLCERYDCWLISDEVYDNYIYSGNFTTALDKSDNVIYINSWSKTFAATGWRIGYCIADKKLIKQMTLLQSQISGPPNTVMQKAAIYANRYSFYAPVDKEILKERRDYLCSINPKFEEWKPQAGFYFYIPVENSVMTCAELISHNIIAIPGDDYGVPNTIRISFANISLEDLKEIEPYLRNI